jgi:hypothetical protein
MPKGGYGLPFEGEGRHRAEGPGSDSTGYGSDRRVSLDAIRWENEDGKLGKHVDVAVEHNHFQVLGVGGNHLVRIGVGGYGAQTRPAEYRGQRQFGTALCEQHLAGACANGTVFR